MFLLTKKSNFFVTTNVFTRGRSSQVGVVDYLCQKLNSLGEGFCVKKVVSGDHCVVQTRSRFDSGKSHSNANFFQIELFSTIDIKTQSDFLGRDKLLYLDNKNVPLKFNSCVVVADKSWFKMQQINHDTWAVSGILRAHSNCFFPNKERFGISACMAEFFKCCLSKPLNIEIELVSQLENKQGVFFLRWQQLRAELREQSMIDTVKQMSISKVLNGYGYEVVDVKELYGEPKIVYCLIQFPSRYR